MRVVKTLIRAMLPTASTHSLARTGSRAAAIATTTRARPHRTWRPKSDSWRPANECPTSTKPKARCSVMRPRPSAAHAQSRPRLHQSALDEELVRLLGDLAVDDRHRMHPVVVQTLLRQGPMDLLGSDRRVDVGHAEVGGDVDDGPIDRREVPTRQPVLH